MAYLGDGEVGRPEQVLGPLDPPTRDVSGGGSAVRRGEEPLEVVLAHPGHGGERLEVERLGVVAVGMVAGPAQVGERVVGHADRAHRRAVSRRRSSDSRCRRAWSRSRREAITAAR